MLVIIQKINNMEETTYIVIGFFAIASIIVTAISEKLAYKDRSQVQKVATWITYIWIALTIIGQM